MDDQTEADKKSLTEFLTNPDRSYCEGRFLSLAAELARMGYKHMIVAQAGLNVGLVQAMEESPQYYGGFLRGMGEISKTMLAQIDVWADEEEALRNNAASP